MAIKLPFKYLLDLKHINAMKRRELSFQNLTIMNNENI